MSNLKILVIEDEPAIVRVLKPTLIASGATVKVAWSGSQGLEYLAQHQFDVVICDLGLPDLDGHDVIKQIRASSNVPIIVLSARDSEDERINSLDAGGDDFVAKPFTAGELLARIRAAARRNSGRGDPKSMKFSGLEVDLVSRRLILDGEEIRLSAREHTLMKLLTSSGGAPVTHTQIIDAVWGQGAKADTQFVRVLIGQLRQKIEEDPALPRIILTESGVGYRLKK